MEEIVAAVQEARGWSHRNSCNNGSTSNLCRFQVLRFLKGSLSGDVGATCARAADRRANCGGAHSTNYEDIVAELKIVPQEQFSERSCEQIVGIPVSQVDVEEITNVIESLQSPVRAISNETQGKYSSKEEFWTDKHELKNAVG